MNHGIHRAIAIAGSQTALAALLGVRPQAVQRWAATGWVPGKRCRDIERVLRGRVTRRELNPELFGPLPGVEQSA
ncbi:MAG: Cro/CI family transcriptional regulator [Salinisphaera sp.]|nr:Cro/CI family transcriptional regulator [Salinisphaera sp.]